MNLHKILQCCLYCLLNVALFIEPAQGMECYENSSILVDDVCFHYDDKKNDWFQAKKFCAGLGMQLATIDSPEQFKRLYFILGSNTPWTGPWSGANDLHQEGKFIWDEDEMPVPALAWHTGEPNQKFSEEDCTFVNRFGLLTDVACENARTVLCMYRLPTTIDLVDNNLICHCASGLCLSDGSCSGEDVRCSNGWFGPSCQFRSLSGDKQGPLGELADNDDNTCTSELQLPIVIKLKAGTIFTWLRIMVNTPEELGGFNLYFRIRNSKVACQGMRALPVNDRAVDIICHEGPFIVDDVILSWSGQKSVCSVDINGEQNFALLQNTSLHERTESVNTYMLPVDGRRGPRDRCFIGQPQVGHQQWTMTFSTLKAVNEIIIYRRLRPAGYAFMNNFYVAGYDARDVMLFLFNDTGENDDKPTVWIFTRVVVPVKKIVIGLENADDKHHLELCEVEAFGACGPPEYGLFCDHTCDVRCSGQVCHHNGMCIVCAFGDSEQGGCLSGVPPTTTPTAPTARGNRTRAAALPCTTPSVDTSEDTQMVKLMIVSSICFTVLVLVLVAYILKRGQDEPEGGKELLEEDKSGFQFLEDLVQVNSEYTRPTGSTTSVTQSAARDKSNYTVKTTTSTSTHIE